MGEPAYAHYTVEREESEKPATPKKAFVQWLRWGIWTARRRGGRLAVDPRVIIDTTDAVRIRDRDGNVVRSETFDRRDKGEAREAQITSDLLAMDLQQFRSAYKIQQG